MRNSGFDGKPLDFLLLRCTREVWLQLISRHAPRVTLSTPAETPESRRQLLTHGIRVATVNRVELSAAGFRDIDNAYRDLAGFVDAEIRFEHPP